METQEAPKRTERQERYRENRQRLIKLSNALKTGEQGVNEALKEFYAERGHTTLNTYRQWAELGYQVKRGEKALLLWGSPRKKEQAMPEDEDEAYKFWPLAYVFSNLQVMEVEE